MWCVCLDSSVACADCLHSPSPPGVSKTVTVDVKGSGPLWLKLRDLAEGVTYNFRIRAKTFIFGPEVEANITTGPGEGTFSTRHRLASPFCQTCVFITLLLFIRSTRTSRGAVYHTSWVGPDHPVDQRGPGTRTHYTLRH